MTIGIIGLGYVGLTLAIATADHGIMTYGVEVDPHIKECLTQNRAHFYEPGLDKLIEQHNGKSFFCVERFPGDVPFDAFIITVGTPLRGGAKQPNFTYIKSALQAIGNAYNGDQLVILRSTVSVGTTRNVVVPFLAQMCGRPAEEILAAMCPERTVEGKAIEELTGLPQVISGNNAASLAIARELFGQITPHIVVVDSLEEAELVKLYCNTYRDMTFALGNVFCMAAQTFGIDGIKTIRAANEGYARSNIALPGFVAGPCLEKDAYILTHNMPACASRDFILDARQFNESLEELVVDWVERRVASNGLNKTVALSGMAFKGVPETSDLRGSSSVNIAKKLADRGYTLRLHDYAALPEEMRALELGEVCETVEEACAGAAALLVLNNHRRYARLKAFDALYSDGFAVLDAWDVCKKLGEKGVRVHTLGNFAIEGGK